MTQSYLNHFKEAIDFQIKEMQNQKPLSIDDINCPVREGLGENINLLYMRICRIALREAYGSKLSNSLLYEAGRHIAINNFDIKCTQDILDNINKLMIGKMSIVYQSDNLIIFEEDECAVCSGMPDIQEPMCSFEAGFIAGGLTSLFDKQIEVSETKCWGLGDKICRFEAKPVLDAVKDDNKTDTVNLIATLASKATSAIELNKKLNEKDKKLTKQLEFAQSIQKKIIPKVEDFHSEHFEFYSYLKPFRKVGGDFYDFFLSTEVDRIGLAIADMTGHGIDAAMITSMVKLILKHCSKVKGLLNKPSKVMEFVEADIQDVVPDIFFSMIYMVLDPEKQSIRYSNAGHPSAILYRKKKNIIQFLHSNRPLIGLNKYINEGNYSQQSILYEKGDQLFLYTDGIIETKNESGELFNVTSMLDIIKSSKNLSISGTCEAIISNLNIHKGHTDAEDDVCLIGIQL